MTIKQLKFLPLLLILLLSKYTFLYAQQIEYKESNISIISYSKELNLTQKQVRKISEIIHEYKDKVKEKKYLLNSNRQSAIETIKKLRKEFREKEKSVLTKKQKLEWDVICKKTRGYKWC